MVVDTFDRCFVSCFFPLLATIYTFDSNPYYMLSPGEYPGCKIRRICEFAVKPDTFFPRASLCAHSRSNLVPGYKQLLATAAVAPSCQCLRRARTNTVCHDPYYAPLGEIRSLIFAESPDGSRDMRITLWWVNNITTSVAYIECFEGKTYIKAVGAHIINIR